jgi:uncharacterized protein YbaR (Trm112 family)
VIEVCPVCYKFLQTIYDKKKMKEIKLIDNQPCKSMYHKKWSIRMVFVTAAGGEDEEGQEEKAMMKCRASSSKGDISQ